MSDIWCQDDEGSMYTCDSAMLSACKDIMLVGSIQSVKTEVTSIHASQLWLKHRTVLYTQLFIDAEY